MALAVARFGGRLVGGRGEEERREEKTGAPLNPSFIFFPQKVDLSVLGDREIQDTMS